MLRAARSCEKQKVPRKGIVRRDETRKWVGARGHGELWYAGCQCRAVLPLNPGPLEPNNLLQKRHFGVIAADANHQREKKGV